MCLRFIKHGAHCSPYVAASSSDFVSDSFKSKFVRWLVINESVL
jgi:hypothetical protein